MAVSNVGTRMYYPFDNASTLTQDLSGNGYTLSVLPPVPSGVVAGKYCIGPFASGCAYYRINAAGMWPEFLPSFSISLDFYAYDVSNYPDLFFMSSIVPQTFPYLGLTIGSGVRFVINSTVVASANSKYNMNEWHNALATIQPSGGLVKIYLDNILIASGSSIQPLDYVHRHHFIGMSDNGSQLRQFSGCITNVKLYDYIVEPEYTKSNIIGGL